MARFLIGPPGDTWPDTDLQYPLGNHVAWIRETKRTAFGVSFKLDTGRGPVPYDFSCKDDELRDLRNCSHD